MRKLVEPPLGKLGIIADSIHYSGYLEDDNDFLSDISFYDYGDDGTEDEVDMCHSKKNTVDRLTPRDVNNSKLAKTSAIRVRDNEEQVLKKTQKGRKSIIETSDEQSTSGTDAESDQDVCEKPYSLVRRQKKSSKKLRDDASSFDDSEGDVPVQRSKKFMETTPNRRGSGPLYTQSNSGLRGVLDTVDVRGADTVVEGSAVQASQRRKKLCKAADLNSAREKVSKGKIKGYLEMKLKSRKKRNLKSKDHSAMKGIHTNRLEDYSSDLETSPTASSRKSSKKGLVKEETLTEEDVGLVRAKFSGEGNSTAVVRKSPLSTGHAVKHRELKHEHVTGSISAGKREGSNQHLVVRSMKKASKDFCVSLDSMVNHQRHAVEKVFDNGAAGEEVSSGVTEGAEGNKECMPEKNGHGNANVAIMKVGWVMCDSCKKWRCIPAALIDIIESTNCGWFCKDNPDKRFADCSIPQEKTNKEINRELNLSEVSFCEEGDEKHPEVDSKLINGLDHQSQPSTWTLIKHNIFQHRCRKTETLDEQMVCTCQPPDDGSFGCGDDCHNRMLNIECVSQTCPCGDACSNQQFQRRSYKKVNQFRCGKKGFGLRVLEDVSKGTFIIEYVGEVLDVAAYEARQKQYALEGQKHFYFMTLSGSEIIDACYKGNLGRFINHSCEPNCTTEKWMVNGEVCIGLFAIRDLKKGEEITFDYNFVRLCGAAAKKCLCGSRDCRGFIGGDPTTPQSVLQSDSDDEDDPEPIMIEESSEDESRIEDSKIVTHRKGVEKVEANPPLELRSNEKSYEASERLDVNSKQVKTKASLKVSACANVKKLTIEINGGHFEGVEEELNKLVDENGGLCKGHPEVATRYLKLLVLTAFSSSDTSSGEGSRSTRDLSLVLDALLKTQSRGILLEILSRNGSQIMHKIVKQSRMDYKRTPIIRKILKVLEFLAVRRILTVEQINAEPTRSGAESIKDAIFQLSRHPDTEVQTMARHFEGKYLKSSSQKPLKRGQRLSSELSKWRLFPKHTQQANTGAVAASEDEATRKRKRPNRWDQPSQEVLDTTLAGGLPQSFWPFNANNLLGGVHPSNSSDQCIRQIESAAVDELGAMHPGPPSVPVLDNNEAAHIATGVVSGIPVEQFATSSTMGFISQQGICIGIPVSQFQGGGTSGLDFPYMPQTSTNIPKANHPLVGQTSPFSSTADAQESQQQHELEIEFTGKVGEESKVTFGISHSQFFQQMHGIFGSAFHPWQLQALMAPHAWGPFLSGDARIRDLGFVNDAGKQPNEYRASEGMSSILVEPSVARAYRQEAEPPVPDLSPPLHPPPPPPSRPFTYPSPPVQAPKRMNTRPYTGNNDPERSNVPYQQLKSSCWKPNNWSNPRWPKFPGNNKFRNPGFRRDFGHTQRFNRPNFVRQGPPRSHTNWEDFSSRRQSDRNWGRNMPHEESMEAEGVGGYNEPYDPSFQDSENPSGSMPLERPWGYKEEYHNGDCSNYSGDFPQERVDDTSTPWNVHN